MKFLPVEKRVEELIDSSLDSMGFNLVRVKYSDGKDRPVLQIMAERKGDNTVTIDECVAINRTVSTLLEVDDPIAGEYDLEISSPGMDRPLVKLEDFVNHVGEFVKTKTDTLVEERKRFKGQILKVEGETITLRLDDGNDVAIEYDNLNSASLLITDAMLKAAAAASKSKQQH